jgi:hypothetical protein
MQGVASYDPQGDGEEHSERVQDATDRDPATYWTTERYNSFSKPGVGLVLDAGERRELSQLAVTSDTPGFTAEIRAGDEAVSASRQVSGTTTFELEDADATELTIWITNRGPNPAVHVNEVTAR